MVHFYLFEIIEQTGTISSIQSVFNYNNYNLRNIIRNVEKIDQEQDANPRPLFCNNTTLPLRCLERCGCNRHFKKKRNYLHIICFYNKNQRLQKN